MSSVASVIAEQIGSRAFVMMGAKNLVAGADHLTFKVGTNGKKVTHVTVTLTTTDDLYTVRFDRVTKIGLSKTGAVTGGVKKLAEVEGVHVAELRTVISQETGMYLSL